MSDCIQNWKIDEDKLSAKKSSECKLTCILKAMILAHCSISISHVTAEDP